MRMANRQHKKSHHSIARRRPLETDERTYDKSAKSLIATRQFLAMILRERVPEFQPFPLDVIEHDCIDGEPLVGDAPVDPGRTNSGHRPEKIRGLATEQSDQGEGYITFDVLFYAHVPGTDTRIKLLINIEAQRSDPSYDLFHRAWFYLCRLVSSQKERDFTGQDYDSICKVYTIWLCFYLPKGEESSITSYDIRENLLVGNHKHPKSTYDLMNITMIHVGDDEVDDTLVKFLRLVFLSQWSEKELTQKLQDEFGLKPNDDTRRELTTMCNLSTGLTERAEARGEARGEVRGIAATTLKIVRNLLTSGKMSYEEIAKNTDTTLDEVLRIAKESGIAY